ncbi:dipeptidase-6 [Coleophoma cylindrospora]|uniref:Dipeptidase n=1 Tax=Coleophoma cylindrospora TaxID=1849047 RepID=A0A3D8RZS4_9HELO|nr:dipeptidase-6 [Coleophoma cylindrospora]
MPPRLPRDPPNPEHRLPIWVRYVLPILTLLLAVVAGCSYHLNDGHGLATKDVFLNSVLGADNGARVRRVLSRIPLIDGHNDLPYLLRIELQNKIYDRKVLAALRAGVLSHTDISLMKKGQMGGQFWSVYVGCPASDSVGIDDATWAVRDTLEQIDVTKRFVASFPETFQLCTEAACIRRVFRHGKIASMIGIEGGHQVGNSLANIRQMYDLGARYITTTHNCDNAFGTAASTVAAGGEDVGATEFGKEYVHEMNRLGMLIDLSHVSHQTMRDILAMSTAPIMFSHSSSFAKHPHLRNVPDDILQLLVQNRGIIMITFVPYFLTSVPSEASIHHVVEHILHIVSITGWDHVGLGSDFDGLDTVPQGLENVSKYPALLELLLENGASEEQIAKLAGENLIRVWEEAEAVSRKMRNILPGEGTWEGRKWERTDVGMPFLLEENKGKRIQGIGGAP